MFFYIEKVKSGYIITDRDGKQFAFEELKNACDFLEEYLCRSKKDVHVDIHDPHYVPLKA